MIFNKDFNVINKHNDKNFDGTLFNNKYNGTYLLRKKKHRNVNFNVDDYECVYHIFAHLYLNFNRSYVYPYEKQCVHMDQGGGDSSYHQIDVRTTIISSQYFLTKLVKDSKIQNKLFNIYESPFAYENEIIRNKNKNNGKSNICFTSLGNNSKGNMIYESIINKYKTIFPNNEIIFMLLVIITHKMLFFIILCHNQN